ncbi:long-chain fatty acid--CoA ligase [Aeromicrobium sp. PE09-221]|uniref:AMP-dependent synthetase/ligase n=1 Tax=Aeromicrobium sp. PE09-221 TaxID=1898043 RepID=UPI000B3EB6BC|nr:AMP-binding protein [Aeromicrobium sp. PE09-221]OUZ12565.1 long-chain fatty acid--CoA ligase [Aeromicrobium sp. PE09-221]
MSERQENTTARTTLPLRIRERARTSPGTVAIREKNLGIWEQVTWEDYWEHATLVGHGLLSLGIAPGDRVGVHSENRREWLFSDIGITAVRAITVGLYPTNPAAEVLHVLRDSGASVLIAEDQEQLDKALEIIDELPELRHLVYIEPRGIAGRYTDPRLLSWTELLERGAEHRAAHPGAVDTRAEQAQPDDIATLVYTSGTTGPPKGAMLSIANIEFVIETLAQHGAFVDPPANDKDLIVSYLPLCHVAERVFTTWFNAAVGTQVNFAESIETVQVALREVQPTIVFGVPRIWEKIAAGVHIRMSGASRLKKLNFGLWMKVSQWIGRRLVENDGRHTLATRLAYAIGWVFLYRPLRERLGLGKARYAASGAAPIAPEVLEFFMGIGVPMHEVYGMTENSAIATANRAGRIKVGTVGEPQEGAEVRLDPETGEILTRHAGTFAGYWNNPEATARTITEDGWLRTGDVGEWVDGTHLKITDRIKDIIITAGGKNISPSEIENSLKSSPYIKEAIVIGDRRKYLTALIGIELDTVGDWAQRRKLAFTTYRDLSQKPEVVALVQEVVDATNTKFASVETIKRFRLMPKELDHEQGELTATQKIKRPAITRQFAEEIADMYGETVEKEVSA